jgi:CheY-like chemotaxis protein
LDKKDLTILHVEDDPLLANLVKAAFTRFGFSGEMIRAGSVTEMAGLLKEREQTRESVSLIISDMQLPDGTGLDVIREVKTDPAWRMTPVIVLSHDIGEGVINEAYALGANCYLPKEPGSKDLLESLQSFYEDWLENAKLPRAGSRDRLQEALERSIGLRTRTSEFYLSLARAFQGAPDESAFWLDRALNAGNLANLLAFFRNKLHEKDLPPDTIDRVAGMQMKVKNALKQTEKRLLANPSPTPELAYQWALQLTDALDEKVFAEVFGILFPKSAVATKALKAGAVAQMKALASHILEHTADKRLRQKANSWIDWALRLESDKK